MANLNFTTVAPTTSTKLVGFDDAVAGGERTYEAGALPLSTAQAAADAAVLAAAIQRANHTGTQAASTIVDFNSAARAQVEAELIAGANVTITPEGSGATRTLTISAAGGAGATNLSTTAAPTTVTINSDTGTDAAIAAADGTNAGLFLPAEKTKLTGIATGATANSSDATLLDRANHTGTQAASTIVDFNSAARAQTEAELVAGAGITITPASTGATRTLTIASTASGATNLSTTAAPTTVTINSDTGTDAAITAADDTNAGLFLPAEKTKLTGIATGATANSSDATLLDRANHTGTQAASTIVDFNSAARAQVEAELVAGSGITITPAGSGATRTLTLASTGGGSSISRQSFTATAGQTTFTVSGGYQANAIDVYQNGVKLVNGTDVTVSSGTDVVLAVAAELDDTLDVVASQASAPTGITNLSTTVGASTLTVVSDTGGDAVLPEATSTTAGVMSAALFNSMTGLRNRLINGGFPCNQPGLTTAADAVYHLDQWYALTESGSITITQQTDQENGQPFSLRMTQPDVTAKRIGSAQPIESINCRDLRGQTVALRARVRCSSSQAIRWAVVEWTGTADAITKDVVSSWTNATFTTGNFFISTTTTIAATGNITPAANTWTDLLASATISGSANNLIVFFWSEGTLAQNATLDLGAVQLAQGAQTPFEVRPVGLELAMAQRYYQNIGGLAGGHPRCLQGAYSAGAYLAVSINTFIVMRSTPSASQLGNWIYQNCAGPLELVSSNKGFVAYATATAANALSGFYPQDSTGMIALSARL